MEPLVDGVGSFLKNQNLSAKPSRHEGASSSSSYAITMDHGMVTARYPMDSVVNSKVSYKTSFDHMKKGLPNSSEHHYKSNKGKLEFMGRTDFLDQAVEVYSQKQVSTSETVSFNDHSVDESEYGISSSLLDQMNFVSNQEVTPQSGISFCASPQDSVYAATQYMEAKQSFTVTEVSGCANSVENRQIGEVRSVGDFVESRKTSICSGSSGSDVSDESSSSTLRSAVYKPHQANDTRWEAIKAIRSRDGVLGLNQFRLLDRLGCGDIGSVHLSELTGTSSYFAMKVMDKAALASRKKLQRAQTEKEILQSLDHPFLPTLYAHFETDKVSCLVMEFCPGGDLHTIRQRQPGKYFPEHAARFYVAEVLLALQYLHMLGIIYRDLKPENVLVRQDGHIMLSDFDLSLRCAVNPTLIQFSNSTFKSKNSDYCVQPSCIEPSCIIQPMCFAPRFMTKPKKAKKTKPKTEINHQVSPLPELMAEPTNARSMSFVGTHEYLAPEIIKGEGHGSAVDWWTLGIFLYELLYGRTPFKGANNRATLFNVVGQPLRFPEYPSVSFAARDLIRGMLMKEPHHRLGYRRGATEIKQHPFFQNVNWALIRCTNPPEIPKPFMMDSNAGNDLKKTMATENSGNCSEIDDFF
ncbi:hypothetical protein ACSBR2_022579 [Camellia fascicularis]